MKDGEDYYCLKSSNKENTIWKPSSENTTNDWI